MALLIQAETIAHGWAVLLEKILKKGKVSSPRGYSTREILNVTLEIEDGLSNIFYNTVRDINYRFMIAEWLWIQGGLNEVASLAIYNSVMRKFSDDGITLSGAYGPRLMPQWDYIIESLNKPDSRQAVATIWTASPLNSKDIPCTISLQWLIRDEKLHCTVNMRSSDLWLGLPYDYFTFSQLTNVLASKVGVPVGSVTMNLASSHLYEINADEATRCLVDSFHEPIKSPTIKINSVPPVADEIKTMLHKPRGGPSDFSYLGYPWSSYAISLEKDKQHCLEVLRELSKVE